MIVNKQNRNEVAWVAPKMDRWKMNFDEASKGNPGKSGTGCIIRDEKGEYVWAASKCLEITTKNEAEMEALILGLKLCIAINIKIIDIEGDS